MDNFSLQIRSHELFQDFLSDLRTDFLKTLEEKPYTPSEFEQYSFSVYKWAFRIGECFKTLEHARAYLAHFKPCKWHKEAEIVQSKYIDYHYFHYAAIVVTIMDVVLILTNYAFRLGNPPKLCHLGNIIENAHVVRSRGVSETLKKLNSLVEPWRETRNLFIHRGESLSLYSDVLTALGECDLLHAKGKLDIPILPSRAKRLYKSELTKIYKEFEETEQPLFNAISELFSQLLPIYRSWRDILKGISNR